MFSRGSGDKHPEVALQNGKQMPEIVCVAISILGGAVCWLLDCVPVTVQGDGSRVRTPTLHLNKLTSAGSEAADLCGNNEFRFEGL